MSALASAPPEEADRRKLATILGQLRAIEREHQVRISLAGESGSRALSRFDPGPARLAPQEAPDRAT